MILVAKRKEKTKEERIKSELARLNKIYKDIEENRKSTAQGLIERCAYMRISLEDFEKDLDKNGFTEKFRQGNQEPYDRKRPIAEIYNSMNTSYQKAIKQLSDLLPKYNEIPTKDDDGFDDFVHNRDDI